MIRAVQWKLQIFLSTKIIVYENNVQLLHNFVWQTQFVKDQFMQN